MTAEKPSNGAGVLILMAALVGSCVLMCTSLERGCAREQAEYERVQGKFMADCRADGKKDYECMVLWQKADPFAIRSGQ